VKNETRAVSWTVGPIGDPLFSEMVTTISIEDEAAGEFVAVSQQGGEGIGTIQIDPGDWPNLRDAIDHAISQCRSTDDMDKAKKEQQ